VDVQDFSGIQRTPNTKRFASRLAQLPLLRLCVSLASLHDCLLLVVNAVFALGLNPRACRDETVTENWRLIRSPVSDHLKALRKQLAALQKIRNELVHQSSAPSFGEDLELYMSLEWIDEMEEQFPPPQPSSPIMAKPLRQLLLRAELRKLVAQQTAELEDLAKSLSKAIDSLRDGYNVQRG
jgi:hypothetical protein